MENPITLLCKAVHFATVRHQNQRRKDGLGPDGNGTPYIGHCTHVMNILAEAGVTDHEVLIAAVSHDLVEDTITTYEELEKLFGKRVSDMVGECSDNKALDKVDRKKIQIEHAAHISHGAKLVKLADKLSNISGLYTTPPKCWEDFEIRSYMIWAYFVCREMTGTNLKVESQLNEIFEKEGIFLMKEEERVAKLNAYYDYLYKTKNPKSE